MNQRGFDNQLSAWVDAREAAQLLEVKQATVYAYASRGLLGSGQRGPGRRAQYMRTAVLRLKARAEARSGHTAVAAGALRWGEPVLDSSITLISEQGPIYRGHLVTQLLGHSFEAVAQLLWTGALPTRASTWVSPPVSLPKVSLHAPMLQTLAWVAAELGVGESRRYGLSASIEQQRARGLIRALAASVCLPLAPSRMKKAFAAPTVAQQLYFALTGRSASRAQEALINRCLVLCADHELNASTFVARIAASAGADLHSCLTAALATLSGPRHGGACDRVEALLGEALATSVSEAVNDRLARGEPLAGFDAGAYPGGDPRLEPLLQGARRLGKNPKLTVLLELIDFVQRELGERAALDLGLVGAAIGLGLPPGSAAALFAIGRTAGWVAHVLEQRATGAPIRPRARYVGTSSLVPSEVDGC